MVINKKITLESQGGQPTFHNLTNELKNITESIPIKNGICVIFSRHTTCSIIIDEDALDLSITGLTTLQQDFLNVFEKSIPSCRYEGIYLHPGPKALAFASEHGEDARGCHNTEAHLRSSIVGRSVTIPINDGELELGSFGNVYFVDFDQTRPRVRTVSLEFLGE